MTEEIPRVVATGEMQLPAHLLKVRLRRFELTEYCRIKHGVEIATSTFAKWASTRSDGPPFQLMGRTPLYRTDAVDEWILKKLGAPMCSTSDRGGKR